MSVVETFIYVIHFIFKLETLILVIAFRPLTSGYIIIIYIYRGKNLINH